VEDKKTTLIAVDGPQKDIERNPNPNHNPTNPEPQPNPNPSH